MFATKITVEPAVEPITVRELQDHSRIDSNDDVALLTSLIQSAREFAEGYTHRALITQTWELRCDRFPYAFRLPFGSLQSVSSVKYLDEDGVEQTVASSVYDVDTTSDPGLVVLGYDQSWPTHRNVHHAVRVTFVAGYGDAGSSVPTPIRQALLLLAATLYEHRETFVIGASISEMKAPVTVEALLGPYRIAMP